MFYICICIKICADINKYIQALTADVAAAKAFQRKLRIKSYHHGSDRQGVMVIPPGSPGHDNQWKFAEGLRKHVHVKREAAV